MGPSGGSGGASWGLLGPPRGPPGGLLGPLGGSLGPGARNVRSGPPSGPSLKAVLGTSWAVLEASWAILGASWAVSAPSLGPPRAASWAVSAPTGAAVGAPYGRNPQRGVPTWVGGRAHASTPIDTVGGAPYQRRLRRTTVGACCLLGPSWGASWGSLGTSWRPIGPS